MGRSWGRWLNSWGPTAEPRARPPLAVARSAAGGCLRGGFPAADGAAAALSRGQRPPWVLCSGVWVLGRSRSEVVHREDTTRDYQGVLLWDVVLIQSYSCCTRTEGFYLKRDFKKFPKRTWSAPFFASSSQIGRERCSLERSECSPVFLFWLLKCIPVFFFFFSLHLLLVLGIRLTPRERKAHPSTCSSSFPRHTCLINVQLIYFDATPVSSFSSQKKRELSQWSWPFTFLLFFLNLEVSVFEMQREENHKNNAFIFLKRK